VSCVVCQAPSELFLCGSARRSDRTGCLGRLLEDLEDLAYIAPELDVTLSGQARTSPASVGYVRSGEDRPLPLHLGASYTAEHVLGVLRSWIRALHEDNAIPREDGCLPPIDVDPTIESAALWLIRHPTWIAAYPAADELWREVREETAMLLRIIDIPTDRRQFLGRCSLEDDECHEDLWSRPGAEEVTCRACNRTWGVAERRQWLLDCHRDATGTTEQLSMLVSTPEAPVSARDIQALAKSRRIRPVVPAAYGKRIYRLGDVLDQLYPREAAA
jgi:hypothetical protein